MCSIYRVLSIEEINRRQYSTRSLTPLYVISGLYLPSNIRLDTLEKMEEALSAELKNRKVIEDKKRTETKLKFVTDFTFPVIDEIRIHF